MKRIKSLLLPAILLWIVAGGIYLVSPWYLGPYNRYDEIANICLIIGFSLILVEHYKFKKISKKQLIGVGIVFLLLILIELFSIIYFSKF